MSKINLLDECSWENQFEDSQILSRSIPDEAISIYEVYVKEESGEEDGRSSRISVTSGNSNETNQPNVQMRKNDNIDDNSMDLDTLGVSNNPHTKRNVKILRKKANTSAVARRKKSPKIIIKHRADLTISEPLENDPDPPPTPQLVDKDDPRSKLHYVKYTTLDGKTTKIWECGICSKDFRHQYTLMRHLPTHTDERNFKCDICSKAFRQLSTLSQHKAIHSDARPYVCEFCKKTFNRVSTLISHRKTHSENKPHKCHLCGKGFHQKGNLRNHVFTHTNERPYKCDVCNKGFNQMSNLVCHKAKAHAYDETMPYTCGVCNKEFSRRVALRSHEELEHNVKYRNPLVSQQTNVINKPSIKKKKTNSNELKIIELDDKENIPTTDTIPENPVSMGNILIEKIQTKAMDNAISRGQVPFALVKPANHIPVLAKITSAGSNQHMLIPANSDDLSMARKMISANPDGDNQVEVKVAVVATVSQTIGSDGEPSYTVEPQNSDADQVENLLTPLEDSQFYNVDSLGESVHQSEPSRSGSMDDCYELLELAAQGGIQFVRAMEDGRYEVMSNSEARYLMGLNSYDITILEGDEAEAINVMSSHSSNNGDNNNLLHNNVIAGDNGKQIMIFATICDKSPPIDNIEIFDNKDIRILGTENYDDHLKINENYFSPSSKIDYIVDDIKPIGLDVIASHRDLSNILDHQSDITSFPTNSQAAVLPLPDRNESSSISLLNESLSYLKTTRGFIDDFNIRSMDEICMDDSSSKSVNVYDQKIKLAEFDNINAGDPSFMSVNQDHVEVFNNIVDGDSRDSSSGKGLTSKIYPNNDTKLTLPSFEDMKVLGPKYRAFEAASQYHEIKIFGGYNTYFKSDNDYGTGDSTMCDTTNSQDNKEFIVIEPKIEPMFSNNFDDDDDVPIVKGPSLFNCNPSTSTSTITIPDFPDVDGARHMDKVITDSAFLQANASDSDYHNFQSRGNESPSSQNIQVFTLDSLPDLN